MKNLQSSAVAEAPDQWQRFPIREIDDLRNTIFGAELEPMQLAGRRVSGSFAFSASDGVIFSSGLIEGNGRVRGIPSPNFLTFLIILSCRENARLFFHSLESRSVVVILPGDHVCMFHSPDSLYIAATLPPEKVDARLAHRLNKTGIHPKPLYSEIVVALTTALQQVHRGTGRVEGFHIGRTVLAAFTSHLISFPQPLELARPTSHGLIVELALAFIESHLAEPISIGDVAVAAGSSLRSLYRAFLDILGEPPNAFVRRSRLHHIRCDLLSGDPAETVLATTRRWGIHEHGRMSGWYRDVFGELPSATLATMCSRQQAEAWI